MLWAVIFEERWFPAKVNDCKQLQAMWVTTHFSTQQNLLKK